MGDHMTQKAANRSRAEKLDDIVRKTLDPDDITDVRTPCSRGGFITLTLPVTADSVCLCGHLRRVHNMLWNACKECSR